MRLKVGRVVNVDAEVNLADLSPLDRIIAAGTNAYRNTKIYKRRVAESEEKQEEQRRKIRESFVDSLLSVIVPQMERNALLADKGDECVGVLVEVPSRFKGFIQDAVTSHEFDAYRVTVIPPSKVISKFADPPWLLHFVTRGGVE